MVISGADSHLDHCYEFDDSKLNIEQKRFVEYIVNNAISLAEEIVCTDKIEPEIIDKLIDTVIKVFIHSWHGEVNDL